LFQVLGGIVVLRRFSMLYFLNCLNLVYYDFLVQFFVNWIAFFLIEGVCISPANIIKGVHIVIVRYYIIRAIIGASCTTPSFSVYKVCTYI
jgi:hypothetical protein